MRGKKFGEEQIIGVLKEAQTGMPTCAPIVFVFRYESI